MAFAVEDLQDLFRLLEQQPHWKSALRASLLGQEFLQLPPLVRELGETQRGTQEEVHALAQAHARTQQDLRELAEAQRWTQEHIRHLAEAQQLTNQRLGRLEDALGLTIDEHAEDILRLVLREKGLEILDEPRSVPVDQEGQVDLAAVCRDPGGEAGGGGGGVQGTAHGGGCQAAGRPHRVGEFSGSPAGGGAPRTLPGLRVRDPGGPRGRGSGPSNGTGPAGSPGGGRRTRGLAGVDAPNLS